MLFERCPTFAAFHRYLFVLWIIDGQFKRPLRVIAFNIDEGWSRDVTPVAWKLLELNHRGTPLGAAARAFVERITGENPVVAV